MACILLLFSGLGAAVYIATAQQDRIVQELLDSFNQDFNGTVQIRDSHIEPFANFPYISIDLEDLSIYEGKELLPESRIIQVADANIGFNIWDIVQGNYTVKAIDLNSGVFKIVQHCDGEFNIAKALQSDKPVDSLQEDFHLDIQSIQLKNIDISKLNEENNVLIDVFITEAQTNYTTNDSIIDINLDSRFEITLVKEEDTTFLKHKHLEVKTGFKLYKETNRLSFDPTEILLEGASFNFAGYMILNQDLEVDLRFSGNKPNFNLFVSLVPEPLAGTLRNFDNKGEIYFDAHIKGKAGMGNNPGITAVFGCKEGYFSNSETGKKLDQIGFRGLFTNGAKHKPETMKFVLENFSAKPEAGIFSGKLTVSNFESPEIDMRLISDFDLDFLSQFLNMKEIKDLKGRVKLTMNFRDIIDLAHPEKSIERLNESYASTLDIQNLSFKSENLPLPLDNLSLHAHSSGHKVLIDYLNIKAGKSELQIKGNISDLPAILHHTATPVNSHLTIQSRWLDLEELSRSADSTAGIQEQVKNLDLQVSFTASARAFTESPNLPPGEFKIHKLQAGFTHYPHRLHDFKSEIIIDTNQIRITDFSGFIDQSDFHLNAVLKNYALWFDPIKMGDTYVEADFRSELLQFHDLFSYKGENYVPKEYRHEEIRDFHLHAQSNLHFKDSLYSTDINLTALEGKFKIHPLKLEKFKGRIELNPEQLRVHALSGIIGNSDLLVNGTYHLKTNDARHKHAISIQSRNLDLNQLLSFNSTPGDTQAKVDHDSVYSLYDFEFPELHFQADIQKFRYGKYELSNIQTGIRMQSNHMIYFDTCRLDAAGGHINITGYFSGKDKTHIYFNPKIRLEQVDLDKLMIKFDNFGQDHLVSENLHGKISGTITGKIHLHADFVPKLDDSDMVIEMVVDHGRLDNYSPMLALKDYFQENKLKSVVFDTLRNTLILKRGVLDIPLMSIQSNLGFLEISGSQKIEDKMDMNYLVGVPWKLIGQAARYKLFGNKESADSSAQTDIMRREDNSKMLFVRITGDPDNYKMSVGKKEK